jgi:hypothetical protein
VKPTMMRMARVGYFAGSSWAEARAITNAPIAIAPSAANPTLPIRKRLRGVRMKFNFLRSDLKAA